MVQQPPLRCTGPCSQAPPQGARQCDCTYPTWCWNLRPTWGRNTEIWVCWGPLMHMLNTTKETSLGPDPKGCSQQLKSPAQGERFFYRQVRNVRAEATLCLIFFLNFIKWKLEHSLSLTQTHTHKHTRTHIHSVLPQWVMHVLVTKATLRRRCPGQKWAWLSFQQKQEEGTVQTAHIFLQWSKTL